MSPSIDVERVEQVLLADGWHHVRDSSFELGPYEFKREDTILALAPRDGDVPVTGAMWMEPDGSIVACPLTAILAVRWETGERGSF